jgi:phage baseplate assembly protein W
MPQNFKKYSFKSVGSTPKDIAELDEENPEIPFGFKTPLEFGFSNDGLLKMHDDLANQMADNFRNMLLTNRGERLGIYNFGANLRELVFELGSENADMEAMTRIMKATSNYMPYISLKEFMPHVNHEDNESLSNIAIQLIYDIPLLNSFNRSLQITLFIAG